MKLTKQIIALLTFALAALTLSAQDLKPTETKALLNVVVTDFDQNPLAAEIIMFQNSKGQSVKRKTNENGEFKILLPEGDTYEIAHQSLAEQKEYSTIEIPDKPGAMSANLQVQIDVDTTRTFELDVHFVTNEAKIYQESFDVLQQVAEFMKTKSDIKIQIAGHTDSDGSSESNLTLSRNRAQAVKKKLMEYGVDENRMKTTGFGESKPIADNSTADGKARNRRTEVRILN